MSFKFKIGDVVVPIKDPQQKDLPREACRVLAIQLGDYIEVKPLRTKGTCRFLAKAADYERLEIHAASDLTFLDNP